MTDTVKNINKGLLLAVLCFLAACHPPDCSQKANGTLTPPAIYLTDSSSVVPSDSLSTVEKQQLQSGDILLRRGYGMISDYIAEVLDEIYPITHCGLVLVSKDSVQILHTVLNDNINGMFVEDLMSYCQQSKEGTMIAVRPKIDSADRVKVVNRCKQLLSINIPFDMAFDDRNKDKYYCVEFLRDVYQEVLGVDLLNRRCTKDGIDVLRMDNFMDTTKFECIFNHFENSENTK